MDTPGPQVRAPFPSDQPAGSPAPSGPPATWIPTRALSRAVLLTGLLLVGAVLLGRFDLAVLAAPFALGTAWALRRGPALLPRVALAALGPAVEGADIAATMSVGNPDRVDYDVIVARALYSPWLRYRQADRAYAVELAAGRVEDVAFEGRALRWGRHGFGPGRAYAATCDALFVSTEVHAPARLVKVYPATAPFAADQAMPRAAGMAGVHRSRLRGEDGELAGVRAFAPGDRLRRIDWRVTLRTRQLHVAQMLSHRDAEVVLLIDVLHEAGRSGGVEGTASVFDTTVRAAAAIAEHYLQEGDRVSLVEYSGPARRLRPASGRRQYLAILEWLLNVKVFAGGGVEPPAYAFGTHVVPASALGVVLTPLLDQRSAEMIAHLARSGRSVVAVDTLGDAVLDMATRNEWSPLAYRLWRLERENTIGLLREAGVPLVAWAGARSLDQVLRDVTRMAAAPRVVVR